LLAGRNCNGQGFKGPHEQYFNQITKVQNQFNPQILDLHSFLQQFLLFKKKNKLIQEGDKIFLIRISL